MSRKRDEVRERAVRTYRSLIRGLTPTEIAKLEGLPLRTVYWYLEQGGRILGGQLRALTEAGLIQMLFLSHLERKRHLWALYQTTNQASAKVACLGRLADEDERLLILVDRMRLGTVKEPEGGPVEGLVRALKEVLTFEQRHQVAVWIRQSVA